jgi:protocatechuate 3,4-dioxygenase beta subunit
MFFDDGVDVVLSVVPETRQKLLIAKKQGPNSYRFDIRLRGENETPFFDD